MMWAKKIAAGVLAAALSLTLGTQRKWERDQ